MSPRHACLGCVEALGVSGSALMVTQGDDLIEPAYVSDARSSEVERLQATLGEGPGTDALASGRPILVGDLAAPMSLHRWPAFAAEAARLGVCGMYSFPLALGAIQVGVLDLFNDIPGHLGETDLRDALIYADTALLLLLDARSGVVTSPDTEHSDESGPVLWHAQVHQAAGMIASDLGTTAFDALVRLRAHAFDRSKRLTDVARAVVEGGLRFTPDRTATGHGDGDVT
ncbi:GAF and ANTAR domain-containing protein [Mycobacterium sp. 050134]|uniref:GAF and ANTAR domain-containing protein n=1 Tax=Mycobacterium sp. 050134 TaxID=3096111 RepID=UPI002EDB425B